MQLRSLKFYPFWSIAVSPYIIMENLPKVAGPIVFCTTQEKKIAEIFKETFCRMVVSDRQSVPLNDTIVSWVFRLEFDWTFPSVTLRTSLPTGLIRLATNRKGSDRHRVHGHKPDWIRRKRQTIGNKTVVGMRPSTVENRSSQSALLFYTLAVTITEKNGRVILDSSTRHWWCKHRVNPADGTQNAFIDAGENTAVMTSGRVPGGGSHLQTIMVFKII